MRAHSLPGDTAVTHLFYSLKVSLQVCVLSGAE